jgi:hypothetical protein
MLYVALDSHGEASDSDGCRLISYSWAFLVVDYFRIQYQSDRDLGKGAN